MSELKNLKIALLIDYDNFNEDKDMEILIDELIEMGDLLTKDAFYSNFSDSKIKDKAIKYGLNPIMEVPYSNGKNAVDIRIAIEAMNLLREKFIDCFCLATNDLDFTPIVKKLRREGKTVIGAGKQTTKKEYKNLFNHFINVDQIVASNNKNNSQTKNDENLEKLKIIVNDLIEKNANEYGQALFSQVMEQLLRKETDFNPKNYGANNNKALTLFKTILKDEYELTTLKDKVTFYIEKK